MTDVPRHPAKYSDPILEKLKLFVLPEHRVLDPFAGVGRVHELDADTWGVEIEPEWAAAHPKTIVGNALMLPFKDKSFDAVVTSCTYGNRMADHHEAKDPCKHCLFGKVYTNNGVRDVVELCKKCEGTGLSRRNTYRHALGRPLHEDNSGQMQWGDEYRDFHIAAWKEVKRVLDNEGKLSEFYLNVSNHIRQGEEVNVIDFHRGALMGMGFKFQGRLRIPTRRQRQGANGDLRVEDESILIFHLPPTTRRATVSPAEPSRTTPAGPTEGNHMSDTAVVDDASTEAPDVAEGTDAAGAEATAAEEKPAKERRPRGWLETDVLSITNKYVTGEITLPDKDGETVLLTPHRIARLVKEMDGLDEAPSTGAVAAVLNRWVEVGFIETHAKPFAFKGYTPAGETEGLSALKDARKESAKEARKAAKDAEKAAAAPTEGGES